MYKVKTLKPKASSGIAALVTMVTIVLFLVSASLIVVNVGGITILRGRNELQATRAQFLADAGIQDALIKLARDKDYTGTYSITDTYGTIDITVTAGSPVVITATSTISESGIDTQRTIQAQVTMGTDGAITNISKENL